MEKHLSRKTILIKAAFYLPHLRSYSIFSSNRGCLNGVIYLQYLSYILEN